MYRLITALVIFLAIHHTSGYRWIALDKSSRIPEHAVVLDPKLRTYVGRARHFDLVLPAEVYNSTYSRISVCAKILVKRHFEILVTSEHCEWKEFKSIYEVPDNVVLAGNTWNYEPIYIGKTVNTSIYLTSILLASNRVNEWPGQSGPILSLTCEDRNEWIDTWSEEIPKKAIPGGKTEDGNTTYVARLLNGCEVIAGQVIPELGIASAMHEGNITVATYCQVLVGDSARYNWQPSKDGDIPDYAVVAGKIHDLELMYVARVNDTVGYIGYKEAFDKKLLYEILVNVL